LRNSPWEQGVDDRWVQVDNHDAAIAYIFELPARHHVFLAIGGRYIHRYAAASHIRFTARCIRYETNENFSNVSLIKEKGPFDLQNERDLFKVNQFDCMIAKNSGGQATYGKILAAREYGVPVVIIKPAEYPTGELFNNVPVLVKFLVNSMHNH
jgi:precorrin-6A/cobalt-precorrin-6A reductase